MRIPLSVAAIDPDLMLEACRMIGGRAGVPIVTGWNFREEYKHSVPPLRMQARTAPAMARRSTWGMAVLFGMLAVYVVYLLMWAKA